MYTTVRWNYGLLLITAAFAGCAVNGADGDLSVGAADYFGASEAELRDDIEREIADPNHVPLDVVVAGCAEGQVCVPASRSIPTNRAVSQQPVVIPVRFVVFGDATVHAMHRDRTSTYIEVLNQGFQGVNISFDNDPTENRFLPGPQRNNGTPRDTLSVFRAWNYAFEALAADLRGDRLTVHIFPAIRGVAGFSLVPNNSANAWSPGIFVNQEALFAPYGFNGIGARHVFTHEVGHWLGLEHTFAGGCDTNNSGDGISDTPRHRNGFLGWWTNHAPCGNTLDTCDDPGVDPVFNYMSYSNCHVQSFTPEQIQRMHTTRMWFHSNVHR